MKHAIPLPVIKYITLHAAKKEVLKNTSFCFYLVNIVICKQSYHGAYLLLIFPSVVFSWCNLSPILPDFSSNLWGSSESICPDMKVTYPRLTQHGGGWAGTLLSWSYGSFPLSFLYTLHDTMACTPDSSGHFIWSASLFPLEFSRNMHTWSSIFDLETTVTI